MNIPEKYQREIEIIISAAREFLLGGAELSTMAFLGKSGLPLLPLPLNMSDNASKNVSAQIVRELAKVCNAEYAIMISEAWALKTSHIEEHKKYQETHDGISEHPDRQDIVFITLETPEGFWFGQSVIKSQEGKARGFDDVEFIFSAKAEGLFTCFLPHDSLH